MNLTKQQQDKCPKCKEELVIIKTCPYYKFGEGQNSHFRQAMRIETLLKEYNKKLVEKIKKLEEKGTLLEYAEYYKVHNQVLEDVINLIKEEECECISMVGGQVMDTSFCKIHKPIEN